ncbi:unnamed protein product [Rotaria sordida]|uniref:TauD/TfdA-like domain-containing protein n=1 Tax=Rotaria sordida TaxID=392033 RepID=A0A814UEE5_9BILA|nr:unnamed protein product [Rotaria sordida]CAF4088611.1 unnamed protein product [Rotaria sordida]
MNCQQQIETKNLDIEILLPTIGAIVHNVDLSQPLDKKVADQIEQALVKHQVLFFRDQRLTSSQQRDFARLFGNLSLAFPFSPHVKDMPEITIFEHGPNLKPNNDVWHTDTTFTETPPLGCVLYAREIPPIGGDTLWSSMCSAYDTLSLPMQQFLSTLSAEHSYTKYYNYTNVTDTDQLETAKREFPPSVIHPVIRTHPITKRKCLFVNILYTTRILGLNDNESEMLLSYLFGLVNKPEYTVRWHWKVNDIAFWDNRSTQHYAIADYWPNCRRMERASIIGDKPF